MRSRLTSGAGWQDWPYFDDRDAVLGTGMARKGTSHMVQCNDIHDSMNIVIPV